MVKNKLMGDMTDEEKEVNRAYHRKYYANNKKKMIAQVMKNQKKNKEHINEMQRKRRGNNRTQMREYYQKYNEQFRSPKNQAKYEEKVKEGKDKTVGFRDAEWHEKFQDGRKTAGVWEKRYNELKEKMEKDSVKVTCVFGEFGGEDFVLEKSCPDDCKCDICKDSFRIVKYDSSDK